MKTDTFPSLISRFRRRWRAGLFVAGVFAATAISAITLLVLGVIDFYAGFSDPGRRAAFAAIATLGSAGLFYALWKIAAFAPSDAARTADAAISGGRRAALSALELDSETAGSPLSDWLRKRAVDEAAAGLKAVEMRSSLPYAEIGRAVKWLLLAAAILGACVAFAPGPAAVIARRLLQPERDIPPYTPLRFAMEPQGAQVLYGGEILVRAGISGGELDAPVRCLTRDPATGVIDDSPAYQEGSGRFSRKLEKVSSDVEVAFAVGRARSEWLPVRVLLQPKIGDVTVTVEPPAYAGLPRREFAVGTQPLAVLAGSRVTARLESNRPLGRGALRIQPSAPGQPVQEVAGIVEDVRAMRFTWSAAGAAVLSFDVQDVVGTKSEAVEVEQKITPDERPDVALSSPGGEVLATPDTELAIEASARDDLGLARVALVRTLVGYRERPSAQSLQEGSKREEMTGTLKLAGFGLVPGQVIELTVEAADTNPNLLGVSVSEPARVRIISREQYAELLRSRATLEEFSARYEALQAALEKAREALGEMRKAAESGDAKAAEEARAKALAAHEEAAKVFGQIAKDFPIFDLDDALAKASAEVAKRLYENARQLELLAEKPAGTMAEAMEELEKRLGQSEQRMASEMDKGKRAIEAAKVYEKAGEFRGIVEAQRDLVKDFNRMVEQIRRGETKSAGALKDLAARQKDLAERLRKMDKELGEALDALPDEFAKMRDDGREFLSMLKEAAIPEVMDEAVKFAEADDSRLAADQATVAMKLLDRLLKKKGNGFCEMCNGDDPGFPWPEDLSSTLSQLMNSLIPRPGSGGGGDKPGQAPGGSGGGSGSSDDGFSMPGKGQRLPFYGPPRARFGKKQSGGGDLAGSAGAGRGGNGGDGDVGRGAVGESVERKPGSGGTAIEAVPEAYRGAVKRYFSSEPNPGAKPDRR